MNDLKLSELSDKLSECNEVKENQEIMIANLEKKLSDFDDVCKEAKSFKLKVQWLNVAIADVKDRYSVCENTLKDRDSTIKSLRSTRKGMKQQFNDIIMESNRREYLLSESQNKINELQSSLAFSQTQHVVVTNCIARGDHLIAIHQNTIHELLTEREWLLHTVTSQNCTQYKETQQLNDILSKLFQLNFNLTMGRETLSPVTSFTQMCRPE